MVTTPATFEYGQELDVFGNIVRNGPWGIQSTPRDWMPYMVKNFEMLKDGGIVKPDMTGIETITGSQVKADLVKSQVKSYTDGAIASLLNGAPAMLDTLYELSNAIGNDPNFAATMTNVIGTKANAVHEHTWGQITGTPKDLAGYGISATDTLLTSNFASKSNPIFTGSMNITGSRPLVYNANVGSLQITPNDGYWAMGLNYLGTNSANLGGLGAYGNGNTIDYFFIGKQESPKLKVNNTSGCVGINSNTPYAKLEVGIDDVLTTTGLNMAFSLLANKSPNADRMSMGWLGEDSWGIFSADQNGYKNLALQPWGGNFGVGTASPKRLVDAYVPHLLNQDNDIRIGSYAGVQGYYGIGLNYAIDSAGNPSTNIVNYWGGAQQKSISFPFGSNTTVINGNLGVKAVPKEAIHVKGKIKVEGEDGYSYGPILEGSRGTTNSYGSWMYTTNDTGFMQGSFRIGSAYQKGFTIQQSTTGQTYGSDPTTLDYRDRLIINDKGTGVGTVPQTTFHSTGSTILGLNGSGIGWDKIGYKEGLLTIDEGTDKLNIYVKYSNGVQKVFSIGNPIIV